MNLKLEKEKKLEKNIKEFIKIIGAEGEDIIETPKRSANAWLELLNGYTQDDKLFYKTFKTDNKNLVIVKNIEFTSFCEHHLMPFQGVITMGYIPEGEVLGLSKFGRIVDCFAKRLQIQEKLTSEIGNSLIKNLKVKDIFVISRATHSCISCRGVRKQNAEAISFFTAGKFKNYNEFDLLKI